MSREYNSSTTALLEDVFLKETVDAYEVLDVMVVDFTNVFIQANMQPKKYGEERVIMKIAGVIFDIIFELDSEMYRKLQ